MKTSMCFLPIQWYTLMWMRAITEHVLNITIALYKIAHCTLYKIQKTLHHVETLLLLKLLLFPGLFQLLSWHMDTIFLPTHDRWHIFTMRLNMGGIDESIQRTVTPPYSNCSGKPHEGYITHCTELILKKFRRERGIKRKVSTSRTELTPVRIVLKFQYLLVKLIIACCVLNTFIMSHLLPFVALSIYEEIGLVLCFTVLKTIY